MKRLNLPLEILLWLIILLPVAYLWFTWATLPARVPIHFNLQGEPNGWASKTELAAIVLFSTIGLNVLLLFIPAIDPKRRIENMGSKYNSLRVILLLFMTAFAGFLIYSAMPDQGIHMSLLPVLIGALLAALGNYFQAVKPNYFIGIRTPWTLESETVWRKTHRLGGRLWVVGGVLIALLTFIADAALRETVFISIIAALVLVPVVHSFIAFQQEKALQ
ncbi:SdpI family protein [Pontibacter rugosus]|uniref:SdpI family protein n=1 Tax=Pontibacter rugosus TaxID=1745966 RepID=A0ABW3STU1_9BACT